MNPMGTIDIGNNISLIYANSDPTVVQIVKEARDEVINSPHKDKVANMIMESKSDKIRLGIPSSLSKPVIANDKSENNLALTDEGKFISKSWSDLFPCFILNVEKEKSKGKKVYKISSIERPTQISSTNRFTMGKVYIGPNYERSKEESQLLDVQKKVDQIEKDMVEGGVCALDLTDFLGKEVKTKQGQKFKVYAHRLNDKMRLIYGKSGSNILLLEYMDHNYKGLFATRYNNNKPIEVAEKSQQQSNRAQKSSKSEKSKGKPEKSKTKSKKR